MSRLAFLKRPFKVFLIFELENYLVGFFFGYLMTGDSGLNYSLGRFDYLSLLGFSSVLQLPIFCYFKSMLMLNAFT